MGEAPEGFEQHVTDLQHKMAWLQQPLIRACRGAAGRRAMSAAATTADVVIVGSGIMGLNIAYQLKKRDPTLAVTILEQAGDLGFGSSGYSTGFQRIFYTFDTTMQFAATGTQVIGKRDRPFSREIASFWVKDLRCRVWCVGF